MSIFILLFNVSLSSLSVEWNDESGNLTFQLRSIQTKGETHQRLRGFPSRFRSSSFRLHWIVALVREYLLNSELLSQT